MSQAKNCVIFPTAFSESVKYST